MPAIIEPAPGLDGGPIGYAYSHLMAEKDREFEAWLAKGPAMRAMLQRAVQEKADGFTADMFTAFIEPFERRMYREAQITGRLKRAAERHPLKDPLQHRVQAWLFESQRRHFEAAKDLALFLRAMRAEIDPSAHGGPTFDNPKDLEHYLLSDVA